MHIKIVSALLFTYVNVRGYLRCIGYYHSQAKELTSPALVIRITASA